jgi:hypothetical protein
MLDAPAATVQLELSAQRQPVRERPVALVHAAIRVFERERLRFHSRFVSACKRQFLSGDAERNWRHGDGLRHNPATDRQTRYGWTTLWSSISSCSTSPGRFVLTFSEPAVVLLFALPDFGDGELSVVHESRVEDEAGWVFNFSMSGGAISSYCNWPIPSGRLRMSTAMTAPSCSGMCPEAGLVDREPCLQLDVIGAHVEPAHVY